MNIQMKISGVVTLIPPTQCRVSPVTCAMKHIYQVPHKIFSADPEYDEKWHLSGAVKHLSAL